jgi:frataxin
MSIDTKSQGSFVINKQPTNKQIWWSSPISGPLRFDWVVSGESMHQKEGAGSGAWTYLRDGKTFDSILQKELGIAMEQTELEPEAGVVEKGGSS